MNSPIQETTPGATRGQRPSLGRIVHVRSADYGVECAIITRVHTDATLNLTVFEDGVSNVRAEQMVTPAKPENGEIGWFWPPHV